MHSVRFEDIWGILGEEEPGLELEDGVGVELMEVKTLAEVFVSEVIDVHECYYHRRKEIFKGRIKKK